MQDTTLLDAARNTAESILSAPADSRTAQALLQEAQLRFENLQDEVAFN